jgi:hypothetical protein
MIFRQTTQGYTPIKEVFSETVASTICSSIIVLISGVLLYKSIRNVNSPFLVILLSLMVTANLAGLISSILTYYNVKDEYQNMAQLVS